MEEAPALPRPGRLRRRPRIPAQIRQARRKVDQVGGQGADWPAGGLPVKPELQQLIPEASARFGGAVTADAGADPSPAAGDALRLAYRAADDLVRTYWEQVFQIRH